MAEQNVVADIILENQIADYGPDYPCLYDVRSPNFKKSDFCESCVVEIATSCKPYLFDATLAQVTFSRLVFGGHTTFTKPLLNEILIKNTLHHLHVPYCMPRIAASEHVYEFHECLSVD